MYVRNFAQNPAKTDSSTLRAGREEAEAEPEGAVPPSVGDAIDGHVLDGGRHLQTAGFGVYSSLLPLGMTIHHEGCMNTLQQQLLLLHYI